MSMDRCACDWLVDTDDDCDFYDLLYFTKDNRGRCSGCRDNIHEATTREQQAYHEMKTYGTKA